MDYSFLKLYNSLNESLNDNKFKDANLLYQTSIQLFPDETYLQITNYKGGISIGFDSEVFVVDCFDNVLADITNNVFIDQFVDVNGFTQCKIEFVNLGVDFHGRKVMIKFKINSSDAVYYTKPIKISKKESVRTYRFDYTNNQNMDGISYASAVAYQSIRLALKFTGYTNNSEVGEYYQISTGNNISTRFLRKIGENFLAQNIDIFTFERLQQVFIHDVIYIDGKRITNKPVLEPQEQIGNTDLIKANFSAYLNEDDTYVYEYQIFKGLVVSDFNPFGVVTFCDIDGTLSITFNLDVNIGTGNIKLYDADTNTLLRTWNESEFFLSDTNILSVGGVSSFLNSMGSYYVTVSDGVVNSLNIDFLGFTNSSTWAFSISDGDYDDADYDNNDYLIGCEPPLQRIHNDIFNNNYN